MIKGRREGTLLVDFCRDALIRAFGEQWFQRLTRVLAG